jgi:hypothetical protein
MAKVIFSGWNPPLNTVCLIKMIREQARIPLNEALSLVNRVLNGETVVVDLADDIIAYHLAEEANKLGAISEVNE